MKHVMVDIETLSAEPGGVILSIGACEFSNKLGSAGAQFFRRIDIGSSILLGFTVSPSTVQWWQQQSVEAQDLAFFCDGADSVEHVLEDFGRFIGPDTFLWAKGPDFDCVMLSWAYRRLGMTVPFSYRNTRDVRTVLALANTKQKKPALAHSPIADAVAQADAVLEACAILKIALG